jgi:molybdopterin molybdotransferase
MISFDEAIAVIGSAVDPVPAETVSLRRAADRVLAAPVIAAIDSPRADVSAMDGYALRSADLHSFPVVLDVAGQSLPGMPWTG